MNDSRLLAIGRHDHDGAALALLQELCPTAEAGQEDHGQRDDEAFAGPSSANEPRFQIALRTRLIAPGALPEERKLLGVELDAEQHFEEAEPRRPRLEVAEPRTKQLWRSHRVENARLQDLGRQHDHDGASSLPAANASASDPTGSSSGCPSTCRPSPFGFDSASTGAASTPIACNVRVKVLWAAR
jgi:hypothetical protein